MLAKEANLKETLRELDLDTKGVSSQVSGAVNELIKEVDEKTAPPKAKLQDAPDESAHQPLLESHRHGECQGRHTRL